MKIVGAVMCEFDGSLLGRPNPLERELGGTPIIARTLQRMRAVAGLEHKYVVCTAADADRAARRVDAHANGLFTVLPCDTGERPRRRLIRAARKWSLTSWRGTLMNTTWFDEFVEPATVARVLNETGADAVYCVSAAQPLLDAELSTAMVAALRSRQPAARMIFTQAPPGLVGIVLTRDIVRELIEYNWPLGILLTYRPELARLDPITSDDCLRVDPLITQSPARWLADTDRSRACVSAAFAALGDAPTALQASAWIAAGGAPATTLPDELEVELTTRDPLPDSTLRPRGERVRARQVGDPGALSSRAAELATYDDARIVLGGFGDPLQHPAFAEICRELRATGIAGLAVTTPLVDLPDALLDALVDAPVDVMEVQIDAHTADTYERVHGRDAFAQVRRNIERVLSRRKSVSSPEPLVVPSITRCTATLAEVEDFYEFWIRNSGAALVRGYRSFSGALPADSLLPTTPPVRTACRQVAHAPMLLADGNLTHCGEDFAGVQTCGNARSEALTDVLASAARTRFIAAHSALKLSGTELCANCDAWHQPA